MELRISVPEDSFRKNHKIMNLWSKCLLSPIGVIYEI